MKIISLKIKSYRTITSEQTLNLESGLTLVGPNNAGKTNAMLGLYLFFTGYDNKHNYNHIFDLPTHDSSVKTSITCHFKGTNTNKDNDALDKLNKLRSLLGLPEDKNLDFSINVYFNKDNPVYQVYPGIKRPEGKSPQCSMAQKLFIQTVLDSFQCYYIPSKKSIDQLYDEFVTPFIRLKVASALKVHEKLIKGSVSSVSENMNSVLLENGIKNVSVEFEFPNQSIENLISSFDLQVKDSSKSSIFSKGMGLQAAVLLSSFRWITQQQSQKNIIWLIEEPETYMHPGLAASCAKILDSLALEALVVKTTHAINFVPSDINKVQGVTRGKFGNTTTKQYSTHREATEEIRKSLGVNFSDYLGLSQLNIFVEGETDRLYIEHILENLYEGWDKDYPNIASSKLLIKDFTGISDLKGFLKSNYPILRNEVCAVSLFDGDKAGKDAARELGKFFSNKDSGFNPNKDYVLIPGDVAIEGLFDYEWIYEAYDHEHRWFEDFIVDAHDNIVSFSIRDQSKKAVMKFLLDKFDEATDYAGIDKFFTVFNAIEKALQIQLRSISL